MYDVHSLDYQGRFPLEVRRELNNTAVAFKSSKNYVKITGRMLFLQ